MWRRFPFQIISFSRSYCVSLFSLIVPRFFHPFNHLPFYLILIQYRFLFIMPFCRFFSFSPSLLFFFRKENPRGIGRPIKKGKLCDRWNFLLQLNIRFFLHQSSNIIFFSSATTPEAT